ncbi:capsular polysaccharide transport system permease protein [Thalassococcus halodurans]|uniref:Capsular polysaccharide transport system permease protein n=1 Tax=Thalassococcus halodurans TaxID=373675 RepID=A0A1H5YMU6_9RHOB|nr:capsule biosynthesis protein [Thalassococcus halodurans]SEG25471.1 capsular polysaccharide transport system permease protein [Thalassococcus halodurans]
MTTKPKAKKFRIRRSTPADAGEPQAATPTPTTAPQTPRSSAASAIDQANVASPTQVASESAIDAIRAEGLTGRQLRMARRVAQRHGLSPTSDFDAVRLLRAQGIDPFQQGNALELVVGDPKKPAQPAAAPADQPQAPKRTSVAGAAAAAVAANLQHQQQQPGAQQAQQPPQGAVQLPQRIATEKQMLPSTDTMSPSERRAIEIMKVQKDIAKRRRTRLMLLLTRLAFFVMLPTIIAGYYFYAVATPMYATKSEFLILKNDSAGGGMGGLLTGTQFATNQDAIAVQSYLTSKDAMLRLDSDLGFRSHFADPSIDPIQRLEEDSSNEEAYKVYKKRVQIGYDPTEGVVKMEVAAADPEIAAEFSRVLISYAEERVDNLSLRKRSNAVVDAEEGLIEAEAARREAQEKLVRLQNEGTIIDPEAKIGALRGQINNIEIQLQEKELQLQALLDNQRPNQSRVDGARGDIRRLEAMLQQLTTEMTTATEGEDSLAEIAVRIQLAQADLATRDMMLQAALERLETARADATSQARYLTTSVVPVASEDPAYPRKFENTILSFLIFSGLYLLFSLTASILREQVSS